MKILWTIIIVLAVIAIIGYVYVRNVISKFDFGIPRFVGADLSSVLKNGGFATVDFTSTITNTNGFSVPVDNLYIEVSYNGQLLGKSTTPHDRFIIPANGSITISQAMTISFASAPDITLKKISGQPVTLQYKVTAKIFGVYPLSIKDTFTF